MTSLLVDALITTGPLANVFSDVAVLQKMLDVEAALARVQARLGVIPASADTAIVAAARAERYDVAAIAASARRAGTPVVALVDALTARVAEVDPSAATFVHWGATSQDISDTALVLAIRDSIEILRGDHVRLADALIALSDQHATSVMLGRTLLQPATPITFGLKAAGWYGAIDRSWSRLMAAAADGMVVQCGGAAGTMAALGTRGPEVAEALAAELQLALPDAPWHAHRDRLAAIVTTMATYVASLGKMARDIALLMQAEVGEVSEPGGASSAMPQKRNPVGCAIVLACATRTPGLVAGYLGGMVQEHERAVGGWQAEWPTIADLVQATGSALDAAAETIAHLQVDAHRMRSNLHATRGSVFAERAQLALATTLGRARAKALITEALAISRRDDVTLAIALGRLPDAATALTTHPDVLAETDDYLGVAETLRLRLLRRCP